MKQKAARNKTIDFSLEEGHEYLERCILAENGDQLKTALQDGSTMTPDALYDQYIIGDTFQVMKELPPNFVDLLIVVQPIIWQKIIMESNLCMWQRRISGIYHKMGAGGSSFAQKDGVYLCVL